MPAEIDALQYYGIGDSVKPIEVVIPAATTIAPSSQITIVTGTTAVATITPPWAGFAGSLDFLFTDASPGATTTAGNIAIATTVVSKKTLRMTYSQINSKWYPSY
jgi:hypothetical protein